MSYQRFTEEEKELHRMPSVYTCPDCSMQDGQHLADCPSVGAGTRNAAGGTRSRRGCGVPLALVAIATALAVAVLVSLTTRPEQALTAASTCYSSCPTVTVLALSRSSVPYGQENLERFTVTVTGPGAPLPGAWRWSRGPAPCALCG